MAFPSVAAENGGTNSSATTSHTVNLPTGIQSGDLILVFFAIEDDNPLTWPSGWTLLSEDDNSFANSGCQIRYRRADGTEGSTITVTSNAAKTSAHTTYRVTAHHATSDPEAGVIVAATTASHDPPSLSPSWGAEDTLWFAFVGYASGNTSISAYPTNYTNGRNDRVNAAGTVGQGVAQRELNATSDNPVAFTLSTSRSGYAQTVAVRPAAAGGGGVADLTVTLSAFGASDNATFACFGAAVGAVEIEAGYSQGAAQSAEFNILHTAFRGDNDTSVVATINPAGGKLLGIGVELKASSPTGTKPVAPSAPTITEVDYRTLTLACTDNASNEDGFKWYLSKNGADFAEVTGSPTAANVVTLQYVDLTPGVGGNTYRLRVVAYNAFGDSDPTESNLTVTTTTTSDPVETSTNFPTNPVFPGSPSYPGSPSFPASPTFPS